MEIKPGIGIGEVKFGFTEEELTSCIGKPMIVMENEYIENSGDIYRELIYEDALSFTFDLKNNYRLGNITIRNKGHKIFGRDIVGMPMKIVKTFMSKQVLEIPKHEDWSSEESPNHILLDYSSCEIFLWFNDDILDAIDLRYLFYNNANTIKRPE